MFSCARVKNNIIIQINYKKTLMAVFLLLFLSITLLWIGWVVLVKIEAKRLRTEIYGSVAGAMTQAIQASFDRNHITLLKLEECEASLNHSNSVSKDLAKMINSKMGEDQEEVEAPKTKKH